MVKLERDPDTVLPPSEQSLEDALKFELEGNSNALKQQMATGKDEIDFLGNGVPGYETTGVPDSEDDLGLQMTIPVPRPDKSK